MNTDNTPRFPTPYTAAKLITEEVKQAINGTVVKIQLTPRRNLKPFNWECGHCGNDCSGLCDAPLDARYDA